MARLRAARVETAMVLAEEGLVGHGGGGGGVAVVGGPPLSVSFARLSISLGVGVTWTNAGPCDTSLASCIGAFVLVLLQPRQFQVEFGREKLGNNGHDGAGRSG